MKKILALVGFLWLAVPAFSQNVQSVIQVPTIYRTFKITSTNTTGPLNGSISVKGTGVNAYIMVVTTEGTVSTCSVKLQKSEDGLTSWTDLIAGATCTSNFTGTLTSDQANYVRVNATTFTGSGAINVTVFGFTPGLPSTSTIGGTVDVACVSGCTPATSDADDGTVASGQTAALVIGANYVFDGTNWKRQTTSAAGSGLSTGLTTIQGNASGTAVPVSGSVTATQATGSNLHVVVDSGGGGGSTAQGASTSGITGGLSMCNTTTSAPTNTTATTNGLSCDTSGGLRISGTITGGNDAASATGSAVPAKGDYLAVNTSGTLRGLTGTNPSGSVYALDTVVNNLTTDSADNAAFTENPVGIGGVYLAAPADHTAGDKATILTDIKGNVGIAPYPVGSASFKCAITSAMTGTTSTVCGALVSSSYIYITSCQFGNGHASVGTMELLQDGSGGTTIATIPNPSAGTSGLIGGSTVAFPTPLKVTTVGTALYIANVTTGSSTYVSCQGFSSPVSY